MFCRGDAIYHLSWKFAARFCTYAKAVQGSGKLPGGDSKGMILNGIRDLTLASRGHGRIGGIRVPRDGKASRHCHRSNVNPGPLYPVAAATVNHTFVARESGNLPLF